MKKLLHILFCLPMLFSCGEKKEENDLSRDNLKGKVKEIIQVRLDAPRVSGEIYDDINIYKYDENGKMTEMAWYSGEEIIKKVKYKADENGFIARKIVEGKEKETLPFFSSQQSNEFKYDEEGNLTEYIRYDNDDNLMKTEYKSDEYGNVTETILYVNGELSNTTKYKYKYDVSNNWTMLTVSSDKLTSSHSISREIKYYK
jgi:hypothetical protein